MKRSTRWARAAALPATALVITSAAVSTSSAAGLSAASWADWRTPGAGVQANDNVQWYLASPDITSDMVGQLMTFDITGENNVALDCRSIVAHYPSSVGWVSRDWVTSYCVPSKLVKSFIVTDDMVGSRINLSGWLQVADDAGHTIDAKVGFRGRYYTAPLGWAGRNGATQASTSAPTAAPTATATATSTATATATATSTATSTAAPTSSAPTSSAPTTSTSTTAPVGFAASSTGPVGTLSLPRTAYAGPYWNQFTNANKAGWADPSFFPVVNWFESMSTDAEVNYDKSLGFNTFIGQDSNTDSALFARNDIYYVGPYLNSTWNSNTVNWVGEFAGDEIDGTTGAENPSPGIAEIRNEKAKTASTHFLEANFTQFMGSKFFPTWAAEQYVNSVDVASMDEYFYTNARCAYTPYMDDVYPTKIPFKYCRTASSYGKMIDAMHLRDSADGTQEPIFGFVELVNGAGTESGFIRQITPGELKGAVMNMVIHGARGIIYFNSSFNGPCPGGSLVNEDFRKGGNTCQHANVVAAGQVNNLIKSLAPVINSQGYQWNFGSGLDTMLKTYDGSAYVFSMVGGDTDPGNRTFTLPPELQGRTISVVGENRTITPNADGTFSDNFAAEYTYHVYKIS